MAKTKLVAKAVLQAEDGQILMIRRSKTDTRRPLEWDLPGGFVDDDDENYTAAVVREILEETGLSANHDKLELAYTKTKMTPHGNTCWLFFTGPIPKGEVKLSFEHDKFEWFSLDKAIEANEYDLHREPLKYVRDNNLLPKEG
jgi:8-oxo-dGTP pyrophosphatase MutT (NUDIX family)